MCTGKIGIADPGKGGLRLSVLYGAVKVRELVGGFKSWGRVCLWQLGLGD